MIAFDALSEGDAGSAGTSYSLSHTCSGSSRVLIVHILTSENMGGDIVTGVTYNSVTMTRLTTATIASGLQRIYQYYILAPSTGANNITVSTSTNSQPSVRASSFTGVKQSGFPDASTTNTATLGADLVCTLTTTADNCWTFIGARSTANAFTAGSGTTIRTTSNKNDVSADSNGAITPAGSTSLTLVSGGASSTVGIMCSFAPFVASPLDSLLMGV